MLTAVRAGGILPSLYVLLLLLLAGCGQQPVSERRASQDFDRQVMLMVKSPRSTAPSAWDDFGAGYASARQRSRALAAAGAIARQHHLALVDDWPMPALEVHCVVLRLAPGQDATQVIAALGADPRVAWAQPLQAFRTLGEGGPPRAGWESAWAGLDSLHKRWTGRGITIAGVDTGVDLRHPDLAGQWADPQNFVAGAGFEAELHGTAMAGVMVARADPKVGVPGVAPGARLVPLRACWQHLADPATCSSFTLAKAIQYAIRRNVQVMNLSLSGPQDILLERMIDAAVQQGMVVVSAVDESGPTPGFPAVHPRVIAVASRALPRGNVAVIVAPGEDILTTTPHGSWGFLSGASLSSAHIAGLAALVLEAAPRTTPAQLRTVFEQANGAPSSLAPAPMIDPCEVMRAVSGKPAQFDCRKGAGTTASSLTLAR
jgi:subtilisin family serine protease